MKGYRSIKTCRSHIFFIISFLLLTNILTPKESQKNLEEYLIRTWTIQSGLPLNTITALIQTQDGYVWVGTRAGLSRFDGVRFETFTKQNSPLSSDKVSCLYEDANGVLWIGTEGEGLFSYAKGFWNDITMEDGLSNGNVRAIIGDWKGALWVGTDYGLNRIGQDGIRVYTEEDGLYDNIITALCLDNRGTIWIGTLQGGFVRFDEGVTAVYSYEEGVLNPTVRSLAADPVGNIWIGTLEGLYYLENQAGIIRSVSGTGNMPFSSLLWDNQGSLWMATMSEGLRKMTGDTWIGLSRDEGLPDNFIRCLLIGRDGDLWIGTDTGGLVQIREPQVGNITGNQGIPENSVSVVMKDRQGSLWAGTRNRGLCRIKDGRVVEKFDAKSGLLSGRIRTLLEDSSGNLWVGTEDRGLSIRRSGRWDRIDTEDGLRSNNVTALLQDKRKDIWIGTDKGLDRFREGKIDPPDVFADLAGTQVWVLSMTRDGSILTGTDQGLFDVSEKGVEKIDLESIDSEPEIVSLYEDADGVLWIGTNGEGLLRWDGRNATSYTTADGLRDNYVYSLTEDGFSNLWMSSNRGIMRVGLRALNDFAGKKIRYVLPSFFDETEGMAGSQCSGEGNPSVWKDGEGRLYFPTSKGISILDPAIIGLRKDPPRTIIETVQCDGRPVESLDNLQVSHSPGSLVFHFTAPDFQAPQKIRFRYRLEGYDEDFIHLPIDAERTARYVNLPPGEYRFTVKAAGSEGIWDENGDDIVFEILPSFFRTEVFFVIVILIILSATGAVILLGHRNKQKRRRDKYKTIPIGAKRVEEIIARLLHLLEEDKLFLDPDLTLNKLSLKLRIHYNQLSRIINERFGLSYNDFINRYRVEEAKKRLAAPEEKERTILDIAYSTGFYSKSVFNAAFKKFTGMTPSEYRKKFPRKIKI